MSAPPAILCLLCTVAFAAGYVDAIAGGGGLLSVPALLVTTPDPRVAIATNKGQSVFGALAAVVSYARAKRVDRRRAPLTFASAFIGSLVGAALMLRVRPDVLRPVAAALLVAVAISFAARRPARSPGEVGSVPAPRKLAGRRLLGTSLAVGFAIGAYDGFFGPGTGTLLIGTYVHLYGDDLVRASANAKVANFASNLAAVATFARAGMIDWSLALPMAVAQIAGSTLGARSAIRLGDRLVRALVIAVAVLVAARLSWEQLATLLAPT